jgi:hypothetical protein
MVRLADCMNSVTRKVEDYLFTKYVWPSLHSPSLFAENLLLLFFSSYLHELASKFSFQHVLGLPSTFLLWGFITPCYPVPLVFTYFIYLASPPLPVCSNLFSYVVMKFLIYVSFIFYLLIYMQERGGLKFSFCLCLPVCMSHYYILQLI